MLRILFFFLFFFTVTNIQYGEAAVKVIMTIDQLFIRRGTKYEEKESKNSIQSVTIMIIID